MSNAPAREQPWRRRLGSAGLPRAAMSSWTRAARLWPDESNTLGEEGAAVELQPTGRLLTREVLDAESAARDFALGHCAGCSLAASTAQ